MIRKQITSPSDILHFSGNQMNSFKTKGSLLVHHNPVLSLDLKSLSTLFSEEPEYKIQYGWSTLLSAEEIEDHVTSAL